MDYPDLDQLPDDIRTAIEARASLNVLRMIGHTPNFAPAFFLFGDVALGANTVPADLRELAIIRVGRRYGAEYEHHHHERLGALVGLDETAIAAAASGDATGLTDEQAAVLRWTDSLLDRHGLDAAEVEEALRLFDVNQLADFVLTVGFYQLVCGFLNTFGVTTEGETPPF